MQEDRVGVNGTVRRQKDNAVVISGDENARPYEARERDVVEEPFAMGRADDDGAARGRRAAGRFFYVKRGKKKNNNLSPMPVDGTANGKRESAEAGAPGADVKPVD